MKRILSLLLAAWLLTGCGATPSAAVSTPEVIRVPQNVALQSELRDAKPNAIPLAGATAPNFTYTLNDGTTVQLSDLRGKKVIVNFWATWCLPCREELPAFTQVLSEYEDVVFLGVNRNEMPEAIARFVNEEAISLTMITNVAGDIGDAYGIQNLPITYFLNSDGSVGARHLGALDAEAIREQIEALQ